MAHVPQEELAAMLAEAKTKVLAGAKYYHYKNPDQRYAVVQKELGIIDSYDGHCSFIEELQHAVENKF
jgi:hypothetical protein